MHLLNLSLLGSAKFGFFGRALGESKWTNGKWWPPSKSSQIPPTYQLSVCVRIFSKANKTIIHLLFCLYVQALSDCKRLESLHLSDNHLTSLVGLKGLVSLEVLHVRRNHLTSLDSLPSLAALSELYVNGNRLTTLQKLADSAPSLDVLDARENRLVSNYRWRCTCINDTMGLETGCTDLSQLKYHTQDDLDPLLNSLNRFEELREASLGDNPCTATKPSTR